MVGNTSCFAGPGPMVQGTPCDEGARQKASFPLASVLCAAGRGEWMDGESTNDRGQSDEMSGEERESLWPGVGGETRTRSKWKKG